jgi:very-short-patch-repair endonuclease
MSEFGETVSESASLFLAAAVAARAATLTLPRKRGKEWMQLGANALQRISVVTLSGDTNTPSARQVGLPLPLAGEGWCGGLAASEVAMAEQKSPTWKVSSRLRSNARTLRRNSTDAERILWSGLRDHRLNGVSFRRQLPIGNYIADFVCYAAKLAIELDGGQHFFDDQEAADARRSAIIEAKCFRLLRLSNHDVMTNRSGVLETISAAVAASTPTLTLPRKRERGQEKQRS